MPVLALLSVVVVEMQHCMIRNQNEMHKLSKVKNGRKMQLTINSFRPLFPDKIYSDISVTFSIISDISRFSRQVVTLLVATEQKIGTLLPIYRYQFSNYILVDRRSTDLPLLWSSLTRTQLLPRMADRTRAVKTTLFTSALRRIFSNR